MMILGVSIAFLASMGCAVTKTYAGYMVSRFLQGWGVGPASTVGLQVSNIIIIFGFGHVKYSRNPSGPRRTIL
jgi:MFS family permease